MSPERDGILRPMYNPFRFGVRVPMDNAEGDKRTYCFRHWPWQQVWDPGSAVTTEARSYIDLVNLEQRIRW